MRKSLLVLALVLAACGGADVIGVPEGPGQLQFCEEIPEISADDSQYRDRPVYVGNEMPTEAVRSWASTKPGFETIWIDRDHNGWVTVAFSEDADSRRAEISELFPDDGVVVVEVDWTMERLQNLQASDTRDRVLYCRSRDS